MTEITSRVVRRWYFNGKGYSSRRNVARAMAKRNLRELVKPIFERMLKDDKVEPYSEGSKKYWPLAYHEFLGPVKDQYEEYHHYHKNEFDAWVNAETRRIMETL